MYVGILPTGMYVFMYNTTYVPSDHRIQKRALDSQALELQL